MLLSILGTFFSSIISGGATGILGVVVQRFADYKNRQIDMQLEKQRGELELQKRDKDREIMKEEWAGRTQVAQVEGAAKEAVGDAAALAESYKMEPQRFSDAGQLTAGQQWIMVALDALRGSVRPLLTIYLCVITTLVYLKAIEMLSGPMLTPETAKELVMMVVGTILYLTTTCVLWWFGTRNKQAPPKGAGG